MIKYFTVQIVIDSQYKICAWMCGAHT